MIRNLKNKLIITAIYLLAAALLYLSGIGCVFRYFLGIICPGCGMTRALLSALRLDFAAAWNYHPMFWSVPILYLYFIFEEKLFRNRAFSITLFSIIGTGFAINWIYSLFSNTIC
ncbi:MAG: DUF2752 domain-containing protein [Christensenellaceae bacterium]|nr:DUF2752 domain-containing protein [Christensenellaceae bacterium]